MKTPYQNPVVPHGIQMVLVIRDNKLVSCGVPFANYIVPSANKSVKIYDFARADYPVPEKTQNVLRNRQQRRVGTDRTIVALYQTQSHMNEQKAA